MRSSAAGSRRTASTAGARPCAPRRARPTPVDRSGSMKAAASPTSAQPGPWNRLQVYDQSLMLRKPLTRNAPAVSDLTSSALLSSDAKSSSRVLPDFLYSSIGVTYPTLTVLSDSGMNQNQPEGRFSVTVSPNRVPPYRLQPWK